ncbi:hypothetical protein E0L93_11450 [Rubrobacter taiwanensis]|jgi:hypothetical protein|uniref:Yip1 domain-containing protein n=1 Tax=Rubrobacter taiwanensis TaxID=185139 RepID=A0A4R1BFP6_9ACTN|nr:YIP1 family protein [Rubrobacter taiwanensis]TCJ15868.1 hypothetical protein E0L93_11450 [Rubrobacter taiwanensis]
MEAGAQRSSNEFDLSVPLRSFLTTAWKVMTKPNAFFRGVGRDSDIRAPFTFGLACVLVYFLLSAATGVPVLDGAVTQAIGFGDLPTIAAVLFFAVILAPLFVAVLLCIAAGFYHILVAIVLRSRNVGFEVTFRIYAYSTAVLLLSWIPVVGYLAYAYGYYLIFAGVRRLHSASRTQAAIVALLPAAAWLLILFLAGSFR